MKTLKIYLLLFIGGIFALTSCNLDKMPLDKVSPDNFFGTEGDLSAYTINQYGFGTSEGWTGVGIWGNDNHTDNQAAKNYDKRWLPGEWKVLESQNQKDDPWSFGAIREANYFFEQVLPRLEKKQILGSAANINHYIGEMYFLRAYAYFGKLQTYGDFPIITRTLPDVKDSLVLASKREPRYKVARLIISDLNKAVDLLSTNPPGGKNRISKNAALLFKSRVALYEASWLTYHKGTALVPGGTGWPGKAADIAGLDMAAEIKYFIDQCKDAASQIADAVPLSENTTLEITKKMSNPYFAQFSDNSLEKYPEILMWRAYELTVNGVRHSMPFYIRAGGDTGFTRQYVETFLCTDGKPSYASPLYAGDNSLLDVRKNRDQRLQLFMMTPGELLSPVLVQGKPDNLPLYPGLISAAEGKVVTTAYQIRKGLSDNWYRDGDASIEGVPIFRAAEAYLNYIEASCMEKNGAGIDNKAAGYWKQLRKRAGLPEDYMITVNATDLSKESDWGVYSAKTQVSSLLFNIRRERRCELIEEGFRMNDLKRWRALDQVKNYRVEGANLWESDLKDAYKDKDGKSLLIQEGNKDANVSSYANSGKYICPYRIVKTNNLIYDAGYNWTEAHYLNPINVTHFRITATDPGNLNTSIIYQNPGWPTVSGQGAK